MKRKMLLCLIWLLSFFAMTGQIVATEVNGATVNHGNVNENILVSEHKDVVIAIPTFVKNVNSILDLNQNRDLFRSEIIAIRSNEQVMSLTERVIDEYELDFRLIGASEQVILEELDNYINDHQQPIAVAINGSNPILQELNLKVLEDPKRVIAD